MDNVIMAGIGGFLLGAIFGLLLTLHAINIILREKIANGDMYVFKDGEWFPKNPRANHKEDK